MVGELMKDSIWDGKIYLLSCEDLEDNTVSEP